MTNDKTIPYNFNKRMGFDPTPGKRITRSMTITTAAIEDVQDVWELGRVHRHISGIPYFDAIKHIIRNPRNVSAIALLHTCEAPIDLSSDSTFEALVKQEEVVGFVCVSPNDSPSARTNYIKISIRCMLFDLSLGEEQIARLIYETIYQYVVAKLDTPTKLEVKAWLPPSELNWFKTIVGYINALFQDSYLPLRVADIAHEIHADSKPPILKNLSAKSALRNLRKDLNNPHYYKEIEHKLIFPRLPGPVK